MNTQQQQQVILEAEQQAIEAQEILNELECWKEKAIALLKGKGKKHVKNHIPDLQALLINITHEPARLSREFKEKEQQRIYNENKQKIKCDIEEAVIYLQEMGYVLGKEFTLMDAVERAQNVKINKQQDAVIVLQKNGYMLGKDFQLHEAIAFAKIKSL